MHVLTYGYMTSGWHSSTTGTTDHNFLCSEEQINASSVTELQFCDRNIDCNDGSDEPNDCASGKVKLV